MSQNKKRNTLGAFNTQTSVRLLTGSRSGLWEKGEIRSARDLFLLIGRTHAYTCPSSWHIQHWVAPKSQAEQVLGCTRILAHMF